MSSKLNMLDWVNIQYFADPELSEAIEKHRSYIMGETRCASLQRAENAGKIVNINGKPCKISIKKAVERNNGEKK